MSWHRASDAGIHPRSPHIDYTRTPEPAAWSSGDPMDTYQLRTFTPEQALTAVAYHEAGHAVAFTLAGISVTGIVHHGTDEVGAANRVEEGPVPARGYLIGLAAGWCAELRWLKESGLHTPGRAWVAERLSWSDRKMAAAVCREAVGLPLRFGEGPAETDWGRISDESDVLLDARWVSVDRLAGELVDLWSSGVSTMPAGRVAELVTR